MTVAICSTRCNPESGVKSGPTFTPMIIGANVVASPPGFKG